MVVKAKLTDNVLKVYLPLQKPKVSGTGKNLVIATTMGPADTGVMFNGQPVRIVASAFVRSPEQTNPKLRKFRKEKPSPEDGEQKSA